MTLPSTIKVGFRTYAVKLMPADWHNDEVGYHDEVAEVIRVRKGKPAEMANTLLHELGHAAWELGSLGKRAKEERAVTVLANVLCGVIADNPEVVEYLITSLGAKDGH